MKAPPFPTPAALGAMVRADDPRAVEYVAGVLRGAGGNVRATAAALGVGLRTLYDWRDASPALGKAFAKHALGRSGAGRISPGRPPKSPGEKGRRKKIG